MKITLKMLERMEACEEARAEFAEKFPDGIVVTKTNLLAAARKPEGELDPTWLVRHLWERKARRFYDKNAENLDNQWNAAHPGCGLCPYPGSHWVTYQRHSALAFWETHKKFGRKKT